MAISRIDYLIAALVGFLVGVFAIPTMVNLGIHSRVILFVLPLVIPPLWILGVWLGGFLGRWLPFMTLLGKFVAVGFLNTSIDFGILNILSMVSGITKGFIVGGVNIPGFAAAVMNSYFFNKFWVFKDRGDKGIFDDFPTFMAVTIAGLFLNSTVVILITTYSSPLFGASESTWLNFAKAFAAVVSLGWNFLGYKFFVFRPASSK